MSTTPSVRLLSTLAVTISLIGSATAHDGHHPHGHSHDPATPERSERDAPVAERTWTISSHREPIRVSLLVAHDAEVHLELVDGSVASVPMNVLSDDDQRWVKSKRRQIERLNRAAAPLLLAFQSTDRLPQAIQRPTVARFFEPFRDTVNVRWDNDSLYVESNGMPAHPMLVGISAWQQQVPLPQPYTRDNAWRIPLYPTPARRPMSAKTNVFRGAIALAVNGVPIFNPIKNDG